MHKTGCSGDLACTYLAHRKLESAQVIIVVIIIKKSMSATLDEGMDAANEYISKRISEQQQKLTTCLSTYRQQVLTASCKQHIVVAGCNCNNQQ